MIVAVIGNYKIVREYAKSSYTLINTKGDYGCYGHFKQLKTCYLVIELMTKHKVPKSDYLLQSVIRITTDTKYKQKLLIIQEQRRNRQQYYNVNKGVKNR